MYIECVYWACSVLQYTLWPLSWTYVNTYVECILKLHSLYAQCTLNIRIDVSKVVTVEEGRGACIRQYVCWVYIERIVSVIWVCIVCVVCRSTHCNHWVRHSICILSVCEWNWVCIVCVVCRSTHCDHWMDIQYVYSVSFEGLLSVYCVYIARHSTRHSICILSVYIVRFVYRSTHCDHWVRHSIRMLSAYWVYVECIVSVCCACSVSQYTLWPLMDTSNTYIQCTLNVYCETRITTLNMYSECIYCVCSVSQYTLWPLSETFNMYIECVVSV